MPISISSAGRRHRRCRVADSEATAAGPGRRVLVVGATRVLRPAVADCVRRGWTVVAVARSASDLAGLAASAGRLVLPLPLDVTDAAAVARAIADPVVRDPVDDALVYDASGTDAAGNAALDRLAPLVTCTTVRILTSRWFPPSAPAGAAPAGRWPSRPGRVHLLLGVRPVGTGERWHTPAEISAAALDVLARRADATLGRAPASRADVPAD